MRRLAIIVVALSCLLAAPIWASELVWGNKGQRSQRAAYVPGELLVKYRPSRRAVASEYFRSRWGVSTLRRFRRMAVDHLKLPRDMTVEEALEIYRNDPDVEYAEPNYLRYATATPNDPFFGNLWGLDNWRSYRKAMSHHMVLKIGRERIHKAILATSYSQITTLKFRNRILKKAFGRFKS